MIATLSNGEHVLISLASDGAGSAKESATGSQLAITFFTNAIQATLERGDLSDITKGTVIDWIVDFRTLITEHAGDNGHTSRDYACTLIGAIVGAEDACFFQVGDGAIVVSTFEDEEYSWIFWPDQGEYDNVTFFITQETATQHLRFESVKTPVKQLSLFTDGLQRLALHFGSRAAHAPFFKALFHPLTVYPHHNESDLSPLLASFLSSDKVNARTDDDKTLILASRSQQVDN